MKAYYVTKHENFEVVFLASVDGIVCKYHNPMSLTKEQADEIVNEVTDTSLRNMVAVGGKKLKCIQSNLHRVAELHNGKRNANFYIKVTEFEIPATVHDNIQSQIVDTYEINVIGIDDEDGVLPVIKVDRF